MKNNNTKVHPSKTEELIIFRARLKAKLEPPQPIMERGEEGVNAQGLGSIVFNSRLRMSYHVSQVLSACSSSIFA